MNRLPAISLTLLFFSCPAWAIEEFGKVTLHDGTIANSDGAIVPVIHYGTLGLDVTITNTATVTFQGRSTDGTFKNIRCLNTATGDIGATATASGNYQCSVAGLADVKTPVSGCSSCVVVAEGTLTTATIAALIAGGGGAGGDGAINDGVSSSIKATVHDYTNSNPLAVTLKDTNGDPVSVGGGTQYNQGTATTDTDTLTMAGCVRVDTPAVATGVIDGDRARCIVDATGRLWVHVGVVDGTISAIQSGSWNVGQSGTWNINALTSITNPVAVTGTFWQATQPVSGTTFDGIIKDGTGDTTQANVSSGRLHVDGSGVTQPVSGTVTANIGTFPDNEPINVAQMNGVAVTMGNGVAGTGVQRVTIASDSTGTVAVTQATAANLNMRPDTSGATGAAPPARANYVGGLASGATGGLLSGFAVCDAYANVNVSTATTTLLVTGVSGRHVRICGMSLVTAAANNVALISGTGATCGTGTTGMNGGTTAASGWNFAANSGLAQGNGLGTINQTNATGDSVCIVTSAATQLSGRIAYAIY